MFFTLCLTSRASKELEKLPEKMRQRVSSRIEELAANPLPRDVAKLKGLGDAYRVRVGKYRILYRVVWEEKVIIIFRIALRGRAYENS